MKNKHATKLENELSPKNSDYEIRIIIKPYNDEYCGINCRQQLSSNFGAIFYCRLFSESYDKQDALAFDSETLCVKRHKKCISSARKIK